MLSTREGGDHRNEVLQKLNLSGQSSLEVRHKACFFLTRSYFKLLIGISNPSVAIRTVIQQVYKNLNTIKVTNAVEYINKIITLNNYPLICIQKETL